MSTYREKIVRLGFHLCELIFELSVDFEWHRTRVEAGGSAHTATTATAATAPSTRHAGGYEYAIGVLSASECLFSSCDLAGW